LIETARCADARLELGESSRSNFCFQRSIHFFRVFGRAAALWIVVGPTIDADKEIALPLQRVRVEYAEPKVKSQRSAAKIRSNAPNFDFGFPVGFSDHLKVEVTKWV
jgi:hypothetical protein